MHQLRVLRHYKPLIFIEKNLILLSKANELFLYNIDTHEFKYCTKLKLSLKYAFIAKFVLLQRLLRLEFRIACRKDNLNILLVFKNKIYNLNLKDNNLTPENITERPLDFSNIENLKDFDDGLYFGAYKSNLSKEPIHIWAFKKYNWEIVYTFPKGAIDHIHNLIPDPYNDQIWILTGDFAGGAGIWIAKNNFSEVVPVFRGEQIYRSCVAFVIPQGLLYATDSQMHTNSIHLIKKNEENTWALSHVADINGSCIYGQKWQDNYVFSTTVEPDVGEKKWSAIASLLGTKKGKGIKTNNSDILFCDANFNITTLQSNRKDRWPFLFQYGAVMFPKASDESDYFVFYNAALKKNTSSTEIWQ